MLTPEDGEHKGALSSFAPASPSFSPTHSTDPLSYFSLCSQVQAERGELANWVVTRFICLIMKPQCLNYLGILYTSYNSAKYILADSIL
jgi:hypothetical protein